MSIGLLGKKIGMTRIFDENGAMVPVTVVDVTDNRILQRKRKDIDGYSAVQVGFDAQKESRMNKPAMGNFNKHDSGPKRFIREFRFENDSDLPSDDFELGIENFAEGQMIDVIGTSKGKGFQGAMRRHNFQGQRMTHGSMMHRRTGAIGAGSTPARVWKNQKMPGRMGGERVTVQNLQVAKVRPEDNVILVRGAIPGAKGGYIILRPAIKHTSKS